MSALTYLLCLFAVRARLFIEVSKLPLTITFRLLFLWLCVVHHVISNNIDTEVSRLGIYGALVCFHRARDTSRLPCEWLLIPLPVVSCCLQPPRAFRLLVDSLDKVSPGILQLLLGGCLRECWLLIGSRPSPTCFQTFLNIFTTSTLSTPKCWLVIGCYKLQPIRSQNFGVEMGTLFHPLHYLCVWPGLCSDAFITI